MGGRAWLEKRLYVTTGVSKSGGIAFDEDLPWGATQRNCLCSLARSAVMGANDGGSEQDLADGESSREAVKSWKVRVTEHGSLCAIPKTVASCACQDSGLACDNEPLCDHAISGHLCMPVKLVPEDLCRAFRSAKCGALCVAGWQ